MKLDKNWLTYQFNINLGSKHSGYFEKYFQEQDLFDKDRNTKQTVSSAIQHFQNTVCNPRSLEKLVILIVAVMLNTDFISLNQPNNQIKI